MMDTMQERVTARSWIELVDIEGFLEASDYSRATKETYGRYLGYINDWMASESVDLQDLTPHEFKRFLKSRQNWSSERTHKSCLDAIKAYLSAHYPQHPLLELSIIPSPPPPGRKMTQDKLDKILSSLPDTRAGVQYRAQLRLLWDTWIRLAEICRLRLEHVDLERRQFDVLTKGNVWETKRFSDGTKMALDAWLKIRRRLAEPDCPTLFCSTLTGLPMTTDGLRSNFYRLGNNAGIRFSPHDFRRGGPSHAAEQGMPDRLGMLQGGWKDHKQYMHYTRGADLKAVDKWLPGNDLDKSDPPVTAGGPDGDAS